jgi:Cell wall-associated hydrolases (invasion-associated proteins)
MSKNKALKLTIGIMSTALFLAVPSTIARADSFASAEEGIAGITAILDNTTDQQLKEAYQETIKQEEKSIYANLGVSVADEFVNIRKDPSTDSKVVGKLYRGCAADILQTLDGDWVKIKSGDVEGYIASQFLAIGDEAAKMVDDYATVYATVNTQTLKVREKPSTDSRVIALVPNDGKYVVTKRKGEWVEILMDNDEDTGSENTGYVSADYVKIDVKFKVAISIEEENRIKKQQEEAEQAERERKAKLAQEKAERAEAQRKAEEQKNQDKNQDKGQEQDNSDVAVPNNPGSASGNEIASYALKFVGNPYVWSGTSLTHGTDCSGFTQSVYGDFGIAIPRTSRDQAVGAGRRISESELQPGDLLFYTNGSRVNHVAMYIGNGQIVHAANSRQGIIVSPYKYRDIYCARRVVN